MNRISLQSMDGARAELTPHGAQVLGWWPQASSEDRLFLSRSSGFGPGTAIRGGIPVIFPQFSTEGALPRHGFARTRGWTLIEQTASRARLQLTDDAQTRAIWPRAFSAELCVQLDARSLEVCLQIHNRGDEALSFTAALHSYLRVNDIALAQVQGLAGLRYRDSVRERAEFIEKTGTLRIDGEVDRVYFDVPGALELIEPARRLRISQRGFTDAVVWNPGAARAAELKDLEADGWRHLLCIEAAQIGKPVTLAAGGTWTGAQILHAG